MKVLFALCVLVISRATLAGERSIYDVMYLPAAGTAYGISNYNSLSGKLEGEAVHVDLSGTLFEQTAGLSVTDWLSFNVGLNSANLKQDIDFEDATNTAGIPDEKLTSKGISDPTIGLRFRAFDGDFRFDMVGNYTASTGESKIDDDEANNKQGGSSVKFGVEFGQMSGDQQWALGAFLNQYFKSTTYTNGGKVVFDAYDEKIVEARLLTKLGDSIFIRTNALVSSNEKYGDDAGGSTPSVTRIKVGPEFQFLLIPDFLLRAGITYSKLNSKSWDSYYYWTANVGANYQF